MQQIIEPRATDLGEGFTVRRLIPYRKQRMVGPFIFWDHMGPVNIKRGDEMAVRPHPHIGLSTLTYLFSGEIMHADSLGFELPIKPGEVNWMTAGRGIVHSERTAPLSHLPGQTLEGIQAWIALPKEEEERDPSFHHYDAPELPRWEVDGTKVTLIAGNYGEHESPVPVFSPLCYLDLQLAPGATFHYEAQAKHEAGIYVAQGQVDGPHAALPEGHLQILDQGEGGKITAGDTAARVLVFGGEPFPEERLIWWNFVSSDADRLEQAKSDWRAQRFTMVPGDPEFIPLPEK